MASPQPLSLDAFVSRDWFPPPSYGWWSWWDQRYYLDAALAWSRLVLDPARHWYLPGYPLLAAPFVWLTPAQPFLLPDLACLLASLWLFAALAARLAPGLRHARAAAAALFTATVVFSHQALWAWVVPWTTTPETVCVLACLLAAARFAVSPSRRDAFLAAFAGTAAASFRPADAAVIVLVCAATMGWALLRPWLGWRPAAAAVAAALAGAAIPAAVFGGAYLAVHGWAASPYVTLSNALGFEWRLLPLRWVTLMIDPRPMFPAGHGLAAVFPWIVPGIAGMAVALAAPGRTPRRLHGLVIAAVLADCLVFLSYRDLHQPALWRLGNFHYFKWVLPVFALYAAILLRALAFGPRLCAAAAAAGTIAALVMWRAELTQPVDLPPAPGGQAISLPSGLSRMDDALLARGRGDLEGLYQGTSHILAGQAAFWSFYDYKIFSTGGTIMVLPLRPMPPVASTLELPPTAAIDQAVTPVLARQTLVWGLPCWIGPERWACRFHDWLPAPALPIGLPVGFASQADPYLARGWSGSEPTGRWTDGARATLVFGLPGLAADASPIIALTAHGFVPPGGEPTRVTVSANGRPVAQWTFGPGASSTAQAAIPRDAIGHSGAVTLDLAIANPRRPSASGMNDSRNLGIFVESLELLF